MHGRPRAADCRRLSARLPSTNPQSRYVTNFSSLKLLNFEFITSLKYNHKSTLENHSITASGPSQGRRVAGRAGARARVDRTPGRGPAAARRGPGRPGPTAAVTVTVTVGARPTVTVPRVPSISTHAQWQRLNICEMVQSRIRTCYDATSTPNAARYPPSTSRKRSLVKNCP